MSAIAARPSTSSRLVHALDRIPAGLQAAYRDAVAGRRLAWASPAVFTVGSYGAFYGMGLVISGPTPRLDLMAFAVVIGLVGLLAGIGRGWTAVAGPLRRPPVDRRLLTGYGLLLLGIGLVTLVAYFIAIGYIPLLQAGLEQGRVEAAEEGGAPLRVLSLLTLPGTWILVAQAAAAQDRRGLVLSGLAVAVVALGFTLTGNRAPAFNCVESAVFVALLAAGKDRLGGRGIAILAVIGIVLVLGAGVFGAFRLASHTETYGPPVPGATVRPPNYPALTAVAIKGYLVVPIRNLGYTLDAVPDRIGWRLGLTYIQPVLTALPGKQTTFDADIKTALTQKYAGGGTVPGMLGEAYANLGPIGWLVIPFVVGLAITALYRLCQCGAPELAALYGYAIAHVSIGGVLSGLAVASIFPFEAYAVLGFAILGLPMIERRLARPAGARPAGT